MAIGKITTDKTHRAVTRRQLSFLLLILSVCMSLCVCVWAKLPGSNKMMMMMMIESKEMEQRWMINTSYKYESLYSILIRKSSLLRCVLVFNSVLHRHNHHAVHTTYRLSLKSLLLDSLLSSPSSSFHLVIFVNYFTHDTVGK